MIIPNEVKPPPYGQIRLFQVTPNVMILAQAVKPIVSAQIFRGLGTMTGLDVSPVVRG